MALRFDPRGDLPPPAIQSRSYFQPRSSLLNSDSRLSSRRLSSLALPSKPRSKNCYDWIFSSASNVHVAVDRSAFKEYTVFDSYVLALSDFRKLHVMGIGTVELKIKRSPDGRDTNSILLTDVLHVPSWLCNIFSDAHFNLGHEYEHKWTNTGVQFSKREDGKLRLWGHTESFCSLDRLVLAKRHKDSRSPMFEDKDREIFSINVVWPHSQRKRWEEMVHRQGNIRSFRALSQSGSTLFRSPAKLASRLEEVGIVGTGTVTRRATLSDLNANIVKAAPSQRVSSLKATVSHRNLKMGCYRNTKEV